ncbi:MAG: ATP-binding protein [bacterium]|nr:ATP-binding protein [bacterium]MDD5353644.1 ATP-binding protein [bacterium]MDD5757259.1 ATP-binding protein [bacterium]
MKINISTKLILNYLLLVALVFSSTTFIILHKLNFESKVQLENELVTKARLISEFIPVQIIKQENINQIQPLVRIAKQKAQARITIIAKDGQVLGDSESEPEAMENHRSRPEVIDALQGKIGVSTRYSYTLQKKMLYVAIPAKTSQGEIGGTIRVALPLTTVNTLTVNILPNLWIGIIVALILTIILGYISAHVITKPIRQINAMTQQAIKGNWSQKIPVTTQDEMGSLAKSLNLLFQQVQGNIEAIKNEQNKITAIISSMSEGVIACDTDSRILLINKSIEKTFNVTAADCQNKMLLEAIRNNELDEILSLTLRSGQAQQSELSILVPIQKIFQIYASPLKKEDQTVGAVLVMHDITELKHLENVRKEFISNVSHELKTPLTSIKGFIETLLAGALEDKNNNRRFLSIIQEHADRLGKLINDILELSKLESKEIRLEFQPSDLREIIKKTVETFTPQLVKSKVTCSINIKDPLPQVQADQDKITQVLINLIDNAIKFNKENGSIMITAELQPDSLKVSIKDTGIGLPAADLPRIFERFYRVDKARSRDLGGTGLGLSIVKHIIEAHHGQVGIESIQERGSTFWFTLPI